MADTLKTIPVNLIDPADDNLRSTFTDIDDLARSIEFIGLIEPIRVTKTGDRYTILAGHRRFEAIVQLGWDEVKALVQSGKTDDSDRTAVMLIENMQRVDLEPKEQAEGVRRLVQEYNMSMSDVATNLGVTKEWVEQRVAMLNVPDYIFDTPKSKFTDKKLSVQHLAMLGSLPDNVRDRLTKDNTVPSEYDIEDRVSKVRAEEAAASLLKKLQKDGILATTEQALKKLVGLQEFHHLSGDELLIAGMFNQAEKVAEAHYWETPTVPTVTLEEILQLNLKGYEWKKDTVYVTKKKGGFPKWFIAKLVVPKKKKNQTDPVEERNAAREAEARWEEECDHALSEWIAAQSPAELTKKLLTDTVKEGRHVARALKFLGIEPILPVEDGIDMSLVQTFGTEDSKKWQAAKRTADELNFEQLSTYAGKNAANLARAAVAVDASDTWQMQRKYSEVEYPEHPEGADDEELVEAF